MKGTPTDKPPRHPKPQPEEDRHACSRSHLRFGWWTLLAFLSLGMLLEAMHGFKVGWYLNVSTQTRRLLFTLAHSHGTLLGLVHIAFGISVSHLPGWGGLTRKAASASLKAATLFLPGGFFLGGLVIHQGDPGLGILLVPLGALLLLLAVLLCAIAMKPANFGAPGKD